MFSMSFNDNLSVAQDLDLDIDDFIILAGELIDRFGKAFVLSGALNMTF